MSDDLDHLGEPEPIEESGGVLRYLRDWGVALAGAVAVYFGWQWYTTPDLGETAPEFALYDLDNAKHVLSDYRGQTVVLNFWATWCGPCRTEIPILNDFAADNPDIPVLGIATDGPPKKLAEAAEALGIDYPVLVGTDSVTSDYQVSTIPMTVVVGPEGELKDVHIGIIMEPQLAWATR